jgi:molybdopterin synthase sulfur carrier subunit
MRVRVIAFAQLRESVGAESVVEIPDGSSMADLREALARTYPQFAAVSASTRIARNGKIVADPAEVVENDDEIALLPPVSGG